MEYRVADQVNMNARLLIVGEAPGREEMAHGRPFAEVNGWRLEGWMKNAGLKRNDAYITYVLPALASSDDGDIDGACERDRRLCEQIQHVEYSRIGRIASTLPNLQVIVCLGNYAARAFTRYGRVVWDDKAAGITSVRGSVYDWEGRYVIPTLAPAIVNGQPELERRCIADWQRIARVLKDGWRQPKRNHIIWPDLSDIAKWAGRTLPHDVISYDIETWGGDIKCVGFAVSPWESITIPTTLDAWLTIEGKQGRASTSLQRAWEYIYTILTGPHDKVGQNSLFDRWWLAQPEYMIDVRNSHWDTMAMHHALVPNESHSLEFLTSIHTDEPYFKDEAKDAEAIIKVARSGMDRLYVYNGLDVTTTHEIFSKLYDELVEQGMMDFYLGHYADMAPHLLGMMLLGAKVDRKIMVAMRDGFIDNALRLRDEASLVAGRPLFKFGSTALERAMLETYYTAGPGTPSGLPAEPWLAEFKQRTKTLKSGKEKLLWTPETVDKKWIDLCDKGISDEELAKLLFEEWQCPVMGKTEGGKYQTDNIALKGLRNLVEERKRGPFMEKKERILRVIDTAIDHRRNRKLASFGNDTRLDDDDRMRCTYKYTTKTGRLASAKNPRGTGTNLQNQDRAIKSIFRASPGRILIECDLSQAEGRIVRVLSGDPEAIRLARRRPSEGDEHTENAIKIFSSFYGRELTAADIKATKGTGQDLRQIGKRVVHAGNYDQGKVGLSNTLLKEGFAMTINECGKLIQAHRDGNPFVELYQSAVRRRIIKDRTLVTSWGRRISFENIRLDNNVYRFGYSYVPQSEIGDLTNQLGVKYIGNYIQSLRLESSLILQVHDSVVLDAVPSEVYQLMRALQKSMETTRNYGSCFGLAVALSVPVEFKLGLNWGKGREFSGELNRDEIEQYVKETINGS